jgi:hypothetical protein
MAGQQWGGSALSLRDIGGAGVVPVPGEVYHLVQAGELTFELRRPAGAQYGVFRLESGALRYRAGALNRREFGAAAVDATTNLVELVDHGLLTGDGPLRVDTDDTLPSPLAVDTDYWIYAPDEDHFGLCVNPGNANRPSLENGLSGGYDPILVNLTDQGTGTHAIGGDQGSGDPVGFEPDDPPIDIAVGWGSVPMVAGETILADNRALTFYSDGDAAFVLTWWWV